MKCSNGCDAEFAPLTDRIQDWEYGVWRESKLVQCRRCGLVTQSPQVSADEVPSLYPDSYLAHSPASGARGVYGSLKKLLANRAVRAISARLPRHGVFVEVGCGNCHLIRELAKIRPDVSLVGVDIADTQPSNIPNFAFICGQFEHSDFEANSADLIYFSNLIEHVPDPVAFLEKCLTVLKPGGVILGVTPDHLSLDRYVFGAYWAGYHYPRHTFIFDHNNLRILLENVGYGDISIRGSYAFWYLSFANRFLKLPGTRKRGLGFAATTALFLPIDLVVNLFRCHGSMTFAARKPCARHADATIAGLAESRGRRRRLRNAV